MKVDGGESVVTDYSNLHVALPLLLVVAIHQRGRIAANNIILDKTSLLI